MHKFTLYILHILETPFMVEKWNFHMASKWVGLFPWKQSQPLTPTYNAIIHRYLSSPTLNIFNINLPCSPYSSRRVLYKNKKMKSTKVQTLRKLRMHGTAKLMGWAICSIYALLVVSRRRVRHRLCRSRYTPYVVTSCAFKIHRPGRGKPN